MDSFTCNLAELELDVLVGISDYDLGILVARLAGWSMENRHYEEQLGNIRIEIRPAEWIFIRPDGSHYFPRVNDNDVRSEFWVCARRYIEVAESALDLFAGQDGFRLESSAEGLWITSCPSVVSGHRYHEIHKDAAVAVARLFLRKNITDRLLK